MSIINESLQNYRRLVFNYALYKTGDFQAAEDITSQSMSLFLLKEDKIEKDNIRSWLLASCNIYCNQYFDDKKRTQKIKENFKQQLISHIDKQAKLESDTKLLNSYRKSFNMLSENNLKAILFYFQCGNNVRAMCKISGESYSKLQKKIYRIKKSLKAETYQNLGMVASQKIVTPKLNNLILIFLKRFKKHLEAKTLHKMYYYFSEVDLKKYNPDFEINKIIDYRIHIENKVYTANIIFKNQVDIINSFYIKFYINKKKHFKILSPPTKDLITKIPKDSAAENSLKDLLKNYPEDNFGYTKIPKQLIENILDKLKN